MRELVPVALGKSVGEWVEVEVAVLTGVRLGVAVRVKLMVRVGVGVGGVYLNSTSSSVKS